MGFLSGRLLGLFLAWLLYHKPRGLPQKIADSLDGFYQAVVHKYYVDELYAAAVRQAADRRLDTNSLAGVDRK
jgi:NADH:ubiquinone oxidoreductase subunit 5 (subunit L)/multisubunit Na+/H+ antiporter MnhA subunit